MKKLSFKTAFIAMCLCLSLFVASTVSAHIVEQDGSIEAVLHIDPGDSPIVNAPAVLHFDFTASQNNIDLHNCNCTLSISNNGSSLLEKNFADESIVISTSTASVVYTFPAKAVYTVIIKGNGLSKQPFTLSYAVRVDRETSAQNINTISDYIYHNFFHHGAHYVVFGGAFIFGIVMTIISSKKEKQKIKNKSVK